MHQRLVQPQRLSHDQTQFPFWTKHFARSLKWKSHLLFLLIKAKMLTISPLLKCTLYSWTFLKFKKSTQVGGWNHPGQNFVFLWVEFFKYSSFTTFFFFFCSPSSRLECLFALQYLVDRIILQVFFILFLYFFKKIMWFLKLLLSLWLTIIKFGSNNNFKSHIIIK